MAKKATTPPAYSLDNLRIAVALQPDVVSLQALARSFDIKEKDQQLLRSDLQKLVEDGSIERPNYDRYKSNNPLSTLVVARVRQPSNQPVGAIAVTSQSKLPLVIEGLPDDFPFPVTISGKLLRKKFNKSTIHPTERMAIVLGRRHGAELVATQVIDKFKRRKLPTIVGHFAKNTAEPSFIPFTPGLSTTFNVHGNVPKEINTKVSFFAQIPADLDPYAPSLEISEQKWDPDTGIPIASIIANKHGIRPGHSKPAMIEARKVLGQHTPFKGRRDMTEEQFLVVDPVNAADHDDAFIIKRMRDGYMSIVAIADVAHYVRPGSVLDKTARERGFSHYFPDDTYHMLPHRMVHNLSLKEGRSKAVVYVEQQWDEDFNKIGDPEIGLGVIAAQKQLTYGQLEDLVIDRSPNIASYLELGDALVERMRFEKVTFDIDDRNRPYSYSEMLVSAMMIDANAAFAQHLLANNVPFLSRSHTGSDNVYAFTELKVQLEEWGYEIPDHISEMDNEGLRRIIAQSEARGDKRRVESLIRSEFLNQAIYSTIPFSHFGLNLKNYGHFTSPIRRYGDILGMRGIHTSLGNDDAGLSEADINEMGRIATELNVLQDVSRRVSLDVQKYYAIRELVGMEGRSLKAMIGKIDAFQVEIVLDHNHGLRKTFDISMMPEGWAVDPRGKALIFNNNIRIPSGNHIRIKIGKVRPHMADWEVYSMEPTPAQLKAPPPALRLVAG